MHPSLAVTSWLCLGLLPLFAGEGVDFNRDIRPILSENCFHCHGPDASQRQGELRLDERDSALRVIQAKDRSGSELFRRLHSTDAGEVMPPPESNRVLTAAQIELLGRWIDEGAVWGIHWSWKPLESPSIPEVAATTEWPIRNPIDALLRPAMVRAGLHPTVEAERSVLIRRVTLDLTGLPPTPADVAAFVADERPDAYERLVDRLLSSSAYGERMAWEWLDAARYADSNGYQGDSDRTMWPWRDWVVDAFNRNLPYDQFTIWQLAGDLLPESTLEQKLATGFCRNHMINGEGGRIAEENRVDYVMDMTETTGTLWLGLTFNCCRCHDHKFDALSRKDYYSMFAFFNQTPVRGDGGSGQTAPILEAPTEEQQRVLEEQRGALAAVQQRLDQRDEHLRKTQADWERARLASLTESPVWEALRAMELQADFQTLQQGADRVIQASGVNPPRDTYRMTAKSALPRVTAVRLDVLRHKSHTQGGLARSDSGNFVLTEIEVVRLLDGQATPVRIASADATYEQGDLKVARAFDGDSATGWAVYEGRPVDRDHSAVFRLEQPLDLPAGSQLQIRLRHDSVHVSHNIGRFVVSVTDQVGATLQGDSQEGLRLALQTPVSDRTEEQRKLLWEALRSDDPERRAMLSEKSALEERVKAVEAGVARVMVMEELREPRTTMVLNRGLYNDPGESVMAAVPGSLPQLPAGKAANRLELARWLVSDANPLTARVVVNRFWQQVFGVGLVKTANDFGVQGEIPVHEDLLNWLASDFRVSGWDVKRLMRTLVTSHAYRQSSVLESRVLEVDPENRLLARAPRYRLPSWMLRDQALAVSGLLVDRQGGPPVNVYQPAGVWEDATFGRRTYVQDHGESLYRRSMYIFWRRIIGPTVFFDNAPRQTCSVSVYRTNSPLHALQTFNDVTYVEAARVLAQRLLTGNAGIDAKADADRLAELFRRVLSRDPTVEESRIFLAGLQRSLSEFRQEPLAAERLLAVGESPREASLDAVTHAAWTGLCLAVLNLDEALTKQ